MTTIETVTVLTGAQPRPLEYRDADSWEWSLRSGTRKMITMQTWSRTTTREDDLGDTAKRPVAGDSLAHWKATKDPLRKISPAKEAVGPVPVSGSLRDPPYTHEDIVVLNSVFYTNVMCLSEHLL